MGKASRKKHQCRLQKAAQQKNGGVKLSDAIYHLCEPYSDDGLDFVSRLNIVGLAVTAWNIALATDADIRLEKIQHALAAALPDNEKHFGQEAIDIASFPNRWQEVPDTFVKATILVDLVKRKDELYLNDERMIVDFNLNPTAKGHHLQIKSLTPKRLDG